VPVTIGRPGQDAGLTFQATAGQSVRLASSGTTFSKNWFYFNVFAPDGSAVVTDRLRTDGYPLDLTGLPATGTYRVVIDPYLAGVGSTTLTLTSISASAAAKAAAGSAAGATPVPADAASGCAGTSEPQPAAPRKLESRWARLRPPGAPIAGWAACGFPAPSKPRTAVPDQHGPNQTPQQPGGTWVPDAANLAGKDWITRYGPAPAPSHLPAAKRHTTAVSGEIRNISGQPLRGVTVRVDRSTTKTDAAGRFLVTGVKPGHRVLHVDGRTASTRTATYGVFDIGVDLAANVTHKLPYTVWMPQLDTAHALRISTPTRENAVLTTPSIPGLEVHIPAGTIIRDSDGKVAREVSLTAVPIDRPPFPLPPSKVPVYFTIQPGGGYVFPDGVRVVYPNYTHEAAGTRMNFWSYDPDGSGWHVYGKGTVSADAKQVVPDPDTKVYRFTGAMTVVPGYNPPTKYPPTGGSARGGDPVDLATGLLTDETTDLELADVLPLRLTRTYQQADSESRPFGTGMNFTYNVYPWSSAMLQYLEADLILPDGARVHFRRISPGSGPASYQSAIFLADPTPTKYYGATLAWNGDGWDVRLTDGTVYALGDEAPLQSIRDRFGNTVTITRAPVAPDANGTIRASGPITQITSPSGKWIKLSYDAQQRVTRAEDSLGRTVGYTYTPDGYLDTVTNPAGKVTRYTWEAGRLKSVTDGRGIVYNTNEYDSAGRVHRQIDGAGGVHVFDYVPAPDGHIVETRITDPRGYVRRVTFNDKGYQTADTYGLGTSVEQTSRVDLDAAGVLPVARTDGLYRRIEYEYDASGNVVRVTRVATPDPQTVRYAYDGPFNQLSTVTDALGKVTRYDYDDRGALRKVTDPLGRATTFTVNDAGQVTGVADPLGKTTTTTYSLGDVVSVTDPLGRMQQTAHDAAGRVVAATDPLGNATTTRYDVLGHPVTVTDPLGRTTTFEYDANGNRTKLTDPRSGVTSFTYDNADRLETVTDPLGRVERYGYDGNDNLTRVTDRRGLVSITDYDPLNRASQVRYGVSGNTEESRTGYTYDAGNRLTKLTDTAGTTTRTVTYTFDDLDRLTDVSEPGGGFHSTYDLAGQRRTRTGGGGIGYEYDDTGKLRKLTRDGKDVTLGYDDAGRLTTVGLPYGYQQTYDYDDAGQITAITYRHGDQILGTLNYRYDETGRRTAYGGSFARLTLPQPIGSATYDAANQLTTLNGVSYTYDNDGNLTSDGVTGYTWNARDQLLNLSRPGLTASFSYDPLGLRDGKTVAGNSRQYVNDGVNPAWETASSGETGMVDGGVDQQFTRHAPDGTSRVVLTDALGSAVALGDESGALTAEYTYDPFGHVSVTGSDGGHEYRFTGRNDDGTGLYYYRGRYYSPTQQRFISRDPTGFEAGDTNLYAYVGNDPVNLVDPSGTQAKDPGQAAQTGKRRLPATDDPWRKYQEFVTGRKYEESWVVNGRRVEVDGRRNGYIVEAKWTGNPNQWSSSPYNPKHAWYDEEKILDQADRLLQLNEATGGKGVRYAVSNEAGREQFEALFREHFPDAVADGTLSVWLVPGNGM
jgi:RHS repeat-associated protein